MRSMPELMLIQETIERASAHLQSILTFVQLSFDEGAAAARYLAELDDRIIDPVASTFFADARELLLQPVPNLNLALMALTLAASSEPECYGLTHAGIWALVHQAAQDTVAAELAAVELELELELESASEPEPEPPAELELELQKRS